jgi:hypothetical protein
VFQARGQLDLTLEALQRSFARPLRRQHLHRGLAAKQRMASAIHGAHGTGAEHGFDVVLPELALCTGMYVPITTRSVLASTRPEVSMTRTHLAPLARPKLPSDSQAGNT